MKRSSLLLALSFSSAFWACAGGSPAPKTNAENSAAPNEANIPVTASGARPLDDESAAPAASLLASPVSGPARDDLPPRPARPLEQTPVDLSTLSEPPRLVVDGFGHTSKVRSLLYTHDGRSLVSAGYDKAIRVWSASTGELQRTLRGQIGAGPAGRIYATSLSQDDRYLAVGGWLGKDESPRRSSGSNAFKVRILDFATGNSHRLLSGHSDVVMSIAFSHQGHRLLTGGGDRRAYIWNARDGRREKSLYGHDDGVTAVAWSPDDQYVATGSIDKSAYIWNADSGKKVAEISKLDGALSSIVFTPSGRSLITAGESGRIHIHDAKTGEELKMLADVSAPIGSLALSPDGLNVLVTTTGGDFASHVFNINSGKRVASHRRHDNVVLASAISPNGKWAATAGGADFGLSVWGLANGREQIHAAGHGSTVWNVGFRNDGSSIAWGNNFNQKGLAQYQLNGPVTHELPLSRPGVPLSVVEGVPDQRSFVRAQEHVRGLELRTPSGKEHKELQVWSGDRRLASIRRDLTSGFVHRVFSLSPDAAVVVSGGDNGVLTSFDATSGRKLRDFSGHTGDVLALAISPDGKRVVSGSSDQTVRLWDLTSGNLLLTVFRARNREWVAYTPSGYYTSSPYGDAYVGWHADRGPEQSAYYFPTSALAKQLRFEVVVRHYILADGMIATAIKTCNLERRGSLSPIHYYRFEDLPQFAPPEVYYLDPGGDLRTTKDRIEVTAKAYSPSLEPIENMRFLINGRPIDRRWKQHAGYPKLRKEGRNAVLTATLPLPEKVNRISVVAGNRYNQSEPVSFEVQRTGGSGELEKIYQPDLYLLSIGVSDYGSPRLSSLNYADKDAESVADAFTKKNRKLYKRVIARTLTEKNAQHRSVTRQLSYLTRNAEQKDVVVVFLSGYAAKSKQGDYYFLPQDADPSRLKETGIAWAELRKTLEALPSKVVLLLDSSHGGAVTGSRKKPPALDVSHLLRRSLSPESGIVIMTSSTGVERSYEAAKWKHGAFTKALLEGLGGKADYDRDRVIYIRELDHFLSQRVPQLTEGRQHPTTEIPRSMPNFPLSDR